MTIFEESKLRFEFDDSFELIASDGNPNFEKVKQHLQGTKDVDFLGFVQENALFFEVKNFRGTPHESIEILAEEVAHKLRDTIAIAIGAVRNSTNDSNFWKKLYKVLGNPEKQLFFIFWLEEDVLSNQRGRPRLQVLTEKLKQKCKWLGTKISVQSIDNQILEGLQVSYLPENS